MTFEARAFLMGRAVGVKMKNLPLAKVYQLLEPGLVVLVTTGSNAELNRFSSSNSVMLRARISR